jgi:transcriptional regulator with XRE-family HTH domain
MNYKKNNITLYIKEVMKEKGIMSKTLQEALGMTQASVSYIINNKTNPSLDTLQRIAEILEVPIWRLFYKETPKELQPEQPIIPSFALICPHCGKPIELEIKVKEME